MMRASVQDLMDRMPGKEIVDAIGDVANHVEGVLATEKIAMRKAGMDYHVTLDVQVEPTTQMIDAHIIGGKVKAAIKTAVPAVSTVLVHLEPYTKEN